MALVLIVDDDQLIATALEMLVRSLGHATAVVHSGPEALAFLNARPVDLMLLDVMMPRTSGLDVLRVMRADPGTPWPPVVVSSGSAVYADEALSLGAAAFVVKTDVDGLTQVVRRHLAGAGASSGDDERQRP